MKKISHFFEDLFQTMISIFRVMIKSRCYGKPKKTHKGEEMVILGNGPSLKETLEKSFSFLEGKIKICVNSFVLTEEFEKLKPEYYVFADPGFFTDNPIQRVKEVREKVIEELISKTKWEMTVFIPSRNMAFIQLSEKNQFIKVKLYNNTKVTGFPSFRNYYYRKNLGMPPPQNVIIPSIILACLIGFEKIFIVGADHSWHENIFLDSNNKLYMYDPHFWNAEGERKLIPLVSINTYEDTTLKEFFASIVKVHTSYELIKDYAQKRKIKIYNASAKSFIDTFERIDI